MHTTAATGEDNLSNSTNFRISKMAERREITGEHSLLDIRMGRPYSPTDPNHIPNSWTPTPDEYQLFAAERARFSMNRHWEQFGMISPNMRAFDYSNILPQTGSISGGVTLTHRPMPRYGPQLQFGEDCKTVRPRCPTCTNVDYISFGGILVKVTAFLAAGWSSAEEE